ncbi:MAG TPA: hypothetical protein VI341_02895 [Actinomycetota bacterium]
MSIDRALRALLASSLVMGACMLPWLGQAQAQEPGVTLTLISQTPITTQDDPLLQITVQATNTSDVALDVLSVGISIGVEIDSRFVYERSLIEGPGPTLNYATTSPQEGSLEPGQQRLFDIDLDMIEGVPSLSSTSDSAVYPAQIDVRSDGVVAASLNTALIHLVRAPEEPMLLSWWTEITGPIAFGPDGRLNDRSFEVSVAPDGSLGAQVASLLRLVESEDHGAIDLAVEPALLDQLVRMSQGYERADGSVVEPDQAPATDAAEVVRSLRTVAADPDVQISAMPFSAPLLPAMLAGGLSVDLEEQRTLGDRTVVEVLGPAGQPTTSFERPPFGAIDDASLDDLSIRGVGAVLANTDAVDRTAQLNDFAPLPGASLTLPSGSSIDLILPDPAVQGLLADPSMMGDPVRGAQAVLGELATIWREQPVPADQPDQTETVRGVAVALSASLPAGMWTPMTRRLVESPFLEPTHPRDFVDTVNPLQLGAVLAAPSEARFEDDYVEKIRSERRDVEAYRSMLAEPSTTPDLLRRDLLYAEAGVYIDDPTGGRRWIDHVNAFTDEVFARALPSDPQAFTLTSGEGQLPLRMGDPGDTPLIVQIQLRSSQFEFPDGNERTVTLREPDQIVTFTVVAKTSGTQTIRMRTRAPSGRPLDERNLAVRTTAVNSVALVITSAAGLVLVALWSRRYIKRPRS